MATEPDKGGKAGGAEIDVAKLSADALSSFEKIQTTKSNAEHDATEIEKTLTASQKTLEEVRNVLKKANGVHDALTSVALSAEHRSHARFLFWESIVHGVLFALSLVVLLAIAGGAILANCAMSMKAGVFLVEDFVAHIPWIVLMTLPLYAPVIWFAFHENRMIVRLMGLSNFYRHKALLGATFESVSAQILDIGKVNAGYEVELRKRLMDTVIGVYGSAEAGQVDSTTTNTPVGEVLEGGARLVDSVRRVAEVVRK